MAKVKRPPFTPLSLPVRMIKLHAKLAAAIFVGIAVAFAWRRSFRDGEHAFWPAGTRASWSTWFRRFA
jgi:hypothetical protein